MELVERVAALERAVASLQAERGSGGGGLPEPAEERLWLVKSVESLGLPGGALAYGGVVELPGQPRYHWQWTRSTEHVLGLDWASVAPALDALGSPVRLRILRAALEGTQTTAELGAVEGLGTTGQLHHHLRTLTAAGWLQSIARGRYAVPTGRIAPLLVILLAAAE